MLTNETLQVMQQRRSIRSYQQKQLTEDEVQAVVESGLYAPNAGNQAWHFTVVQKKELLHRLNRAAKEAARQHELPFLRVLGNDEQFDCLYGAPTLIIISGNEQCPVPLDADCAAATQNLLLAAESLGLGSCWIFFALLAFQSPDGPELRQLLQIPEGYKPFTSAIIGYKHGASPHAPERKPNLITYIR